MTNLLEVSPMVDESGRGEWEDDGSPGFEEGAYDEAYDGEEGGEDDLRHIFEYYASYGEPIPTAELHASKVRVS